MLKHRPVIANNLKLFAKFMTSHSHTAIARFSCAPLSTVTQYYDYYDGNNHIHLIHYHHQRYYYDYGCHAALCALLSSTPLSRCASNLSVINEATERFLFLPPLCVCVDDESDSLRAL